MYIADICRSKGRETQQNASAFQDVSSAICCLRHHFTNVLFWHFRFISKRFGYSFSRGGPKLDGGCFPERGTTITFVEVVQEK